MRPEPCPPEPAIDAPRGRLLLVRLSHLGDAVGALPLFHALRAALPNARIAWAVEREFAGLLEGLPGLDQRLIFDRARGLRGPRSFASFVRCLRRFGPDVAIDAQGNGKSHLVSLASGAPQRFAFHLSDCRERNLCRLLRAARPTACPGPHAHQRLAHLAQYVGLQLVGQPLELVRRDLDLADSELDSARARIAAQFQVGPRWVLHLGRRGDVRSWPLGHSAGFLAKVARRGESVLVLVGPAELESERELRARLPPDSRRVFTAPDQPLRELAADLTVAAERGARFVGPDSGPAHLAAACGLPVTLLAGPQDPGRTGPWPPPGPGSANRVAQTPGDLACRPCLRSTCSFERPRACLEELSPEYVLGLESPV